jgi:hypothetical protein
MTGKAEARGCVGSTREITQKASAIGYGVLGSADSPRGKRGARLPCGTSVGRSGQRGGEGRGRPGPTRPTYRVRCSAIGRINAHHATLICLRLPRRGSWRGSEPALPPPPTDSPRLAPPRAPCSRDTCRPSVPGSRAPSRTTLRPCDSSSGSTPCPGGRTSTPGTGLR